MYRAPQPKRADGDGGVEVVQVGRPDRGALRARRRADGELESADSVTIATDRMAKGPPKPFPALEAAKQHERAVQFFNRTS
jgi:hypothetical protein